MSRRKKLQPSQYPALQAMASVGASKATIAKRLGMAADTLRRILKSEEKATQAFEDGRGEMESHLVGALFKQAVDPGNKNPTPAIFLLKAMRGFIDNPKQEPTQNRVEVTFQLPKPLSETEYRKLIDVTPPKALIEAGMEGESSAG